MQTEACVQHNFLKTYLPLLVSAWGWQLSISSDTIVKWAQAEHHTSTPNELNLLKLCHSRETPIKLEEHHEDH